MPIPMKCPFCGKKLRPNKGWAAMFYDGYCNTCDIPVENGIPIEDDDKGENRQLPMAKVTGL